MAKTKREYILATCFLSGAAAILSFVSLGTQQWVYADAKLDESDQGSTGYYIRVGLFAGIFVQEIGTVGQFELTTSCAFDINACAYLCGKNMEENVRRLYNGANETDKDSCDIIGTNPRSIHTRKQKTVDNNKERIFMNAGVWLCTVIFLILSALMGLVCTGLAVWNTASNPYQVYFSIYGLYIYNGIALFCVLLGVCLFGAMFSIDLRHNVPSYKTFQENFSTDDTAVLGYSYWINLVSIALYIASICLLYTRDYLISIEPKRNIELEEVTDPVIYLY